MYSLALLAFVSFILALILTPLCRNLFVRIGVVDRPDGRRKLHAAPVPRVGGCPLMLAYIGAFTVMLLSPLAATRILEAGLSVAWHVFPAAAVVFVLGLLDDLQGLKPWQKLAGELIAALLAFWGGIGITAVAGMPVPSWLSLPVTALWLVVCANAFNLIDGIDGLAAGAGLLATATMLVGALLTNNIALALATVPLMGALLGFLRYNFNPASIFLGDSGSLTIGFLLGCFGVLWSQKAATILGMTAPLMALAIPLLDTSVAVARRFLRQQPIMAADAAHIHHRLLARGLTPRRAALLLYAACGLAATLSLLGSVAENQYKGLIVLVFCAAAGTAVYYLGYVEFSLAGQMFVRGAFRRHLNHQIGLRTFREALTAAATPEDRWNAICEACRGFGFSAAELRLNGYQFKKLLMNTNGDPTWTLHIPLAGQGHLELTRRFGELHAPTVLVPFAEALYESLRVDAPTTDSSAAQPKVRSAAAGAGG